MGGSSRKGVLEETRQQLTSCGCGTVLQYWSSSLSSVEVSAELSYNELPQHDMAQIATPLLHHAYQH